MPGCFASIVSKEKNCFERVKTSRVKTNVLQVNLLQPKVISSQPGVVNLQNDPGIVNGGSKDLAIKTEKGSCE